MLAHSTGRSGARWLSAAPRSPLVRPTPGYAPARRSHSSSSGSSNSGTGSTRRLRDSTTTAIAAATLTGTAILYISSSSSHKLHADAAATTPKSQLQQGITLTDRTQQEQMRARTHSQGVYAWGSNRHAVVAPDQPSVALVRSPRSIPFFDGVSLRDLVLAERHGVAVDAQGDVLQWGAGFFDARSRSHDSDQTAIEDIPYTSRASRYRAKSVPGREEAGPMLPVRTLVGKDIVKVQATDSKVFALGRNGDVWIISAIQDEQQKVRTRSALSWLPSVLGGGTGIDAEKFTLKKDAPGFRRGEKIVDIAAGESHLLALTNQERTFAAPTGPDANTYGQLGYRRALLNTVQRTATTPNSAGEAGEASSSSNGPVTGTVEVSLEPRILLDAIFSAPIPTAVDLLPAWALPPSVEERAAEAQKAKQASALAKAESKKAAKAAHSASAADVPDAVEDPSGIRYCTTLLEIPALRGVPVVQVAAGTHHSLARTSDGRVLGWGRHTHGQTGVGNQVAIECVTAPTEVVLARCFPSSVDVRCTAVYAGADNSVFVTSRLEPLPGRQGVKAVRDTLSVGKGIWGTLGNASWTQVASSPVRVKTVSGLQEYSDRTGRIHPVDMYSISIGSPGHVALVLDTADTHTHSAYGRDVNVWGSNGAYQLGTGKRNNLAVPQHLRPLPPLTPSEGAEAPVTPDDRERERLREEDINSGALTHMPHNRLQLASKSTVDTRTPPRITSEGRLEPGSVKRHVPVEETMVAGAAAMAVFWRAQA
ncbi:unnamed protein product [Tilletia controversa]|uniref:RCC1/BLIP-II n=1 Tax=Tilletia controversa TaxID=13291 RepID=A0A8X7T0V8_9BASI|nr:hypothetical protein CF328_g1806 [Tilletia controversa]KAE8254836.1 hypothetical protein A4X06_0g722 [Tilletia controversa]CAD6975745.1 unnamed protein product [Tilletia controversa]CAD6986301.1 unnamed protein product [Tilletia controversa]